jgi:hypothetical protein
MSHEYSRISEDVIRVVVQAADEQHARQKAHDYAEQQGYDTPAEIMDIVKNPHLEQNWAVYCTAVK